jgi:hypothetical protein
MAIIKIEKNSFCEKIIVCVGSNHTPVVFPSHLKKNQILEEVILRGVKIENFFQIEIKHQK